MFKNTHLADRARSQPKARRRARAVVVAGSIAVVGLFGTAVPASAAAVPVWSLVPSANPGTAGNSLKSVSCVGPADCTAVGYALPGIGLGEQPLVESWNGSTWSTVTTPPIGSSAQLNGVSCASQTFCVAVGLVFSPSGNQTLIETFDGSSWTVVQDTTMSGDLSGVSCPDVDHCIAVGEDGNTLVESWNGSTWTTLSSPNVSAQSNVLQAVSCPTVADCVAAGYEVSPDNQEQTLVESFDGTTWTVETTPDQTAFNNVLDGISCPSTTTCVAVGAYDPGNYNDQTLTEVWNGTTWNIVNSVDPSKLVDGLSGVSCASASSCLAVGSFEPTPSDTQSLIESFNGKRWSLDASQDPGSVSDQLSGVAWTSATTADAVGSFANPSNPFAVSQTLVETSVPAAPSIAHVRPLSGAPGRTVTITGKNLAFASSVTFNGLAATIRSDDERAISVTVPAAATTGPITVTTPGGSATTTAAFTVT